MEPLILVLLGLLAMVGASLLSQRLGVAAPLLLVVVGIAISLLPFVPAVEIDPEWILAGILPPLLYSASVSMPTMDFRREFSAIGALSVILVVASSLILGLFFWWTIPNLNIWWSIALGAILSPTDAVATTMVKKLGVSPRIVSILEGESLLNDATALVLLRTAIAGAATVVSLRDVLGDFAFAVLMAVAIGFFVGKLNLLIRSQIEDPTINTVLSFVVPFLAAIPADHLGASGLVAAVVAGMVTGRGAARKLSSLQRLSDEMNWRTIAFVLESAVFLVMGLQLYGIITEVRQDHVGIGLAALLAAAALVITILVRAIFVAPLFTYLQSRANRGQDLLPRLAKIRDQAQTDPQVLADNVGRRVRQGRGGPGNPAPNRSGPQRTPSQRRIDQFTSTLRRKVADLDYLLSAPLNMRDGTVVVWAGMRGGVTLAAAQTLPAATPDRSLLIFVAFLVAVGSLLLQGGTLKRFVAMVKPSTGPTEEAQQAQRDKILVLLQNTRDAIADQSPSTKQLIHAQRNALLDARDNGEFDSEVLRRALLVLDTEEIRLQLRDFPQDGSPMDGPVLGID